MVGAIREPRVVLLLLVNSPLPNAASEAFEMPVKAARTQADEMLPGMFTIVWSSFRARTAARGEGSEVKRQCRRQASVIDFGIWRQPPKGASRPRTGLTRVRVWDRSGPVRDRSNGSAPRARIGEYGGFRACTIVFASDWSFTVDVSCSQVRLAVRGLCWSRRVVPCE